jgi:hypothetical protein
MFKLVLILVIYLQLCRLSYDSLDIPAIRQLLFVQKDYYSILVWKWGVSFYGDRKSKMSLR